MHIKTTYKQTEKITRYTISTPLISHNNSADQHEVFITLGTGRSINIPKNGSYQVHTSGVLEVNLDATTTYYAQGEWLKIKDTNQTKMLKHFQDGANQQSADIISLS